MAKENTSFKVSIVTHVDTDKESVQNLISDLVPSNRREKCPSEALEILDIPGPLWMKLYIFCDN